MNGGELRLWKGCKGCVYRDGERESVGVRGQREELKR